MEKNLPKKFYLNSKEDLFQVVNFIKPLIKAQTIFLLEGPVGAGKTEFVKSLAQKIGLKNVASPSFALQLSYELEELHIHHVDLYRLKSEDDLESTGFWDLFSSEDSLVIIEWADMINVDFLPMDWCKIKFSFTKMPHLENERELIISEV